MEPSSSEHPATHDSNLVSMDSRKRKKKPKISSKYVKNSSDSELDFEEITKVRKKKIPKIQCQQCQHRSSSEFHMKRHALTHESRGNLKCPHDSCHWHSRKLEHMDHHLRFVHSRIIEVVTLEFANEEDLKNWMNSLQEEEYSRYVSSRSQLGRTNTYYCHRSNILARPSQSTGKRRPKKQGSNKSKFLCTSRIVVEKGESGLVAKFYKTHSGHSIDPSRLSLTSQMKRNKSKNKTDEVPANSKVSELEETEARKEVAMDYFNRIMELATTPESMHVIVDSLKGLLATMERFSNVETHISTPSAKARVRRQKLKPARI